MRDVLVSALTLAVSILPRSIRVAISRRDALAWAPFFSCKVLSRCTDMLLIEGA